MALQRPNMTSVLETVLYYTDEARTEAFYTDLLGLRPIGKQPGRHLFYRVGAGVLLLFRADVTAKDADTPHGATGAVHTCFLVPETQYALWKAHLSEHGIGIEREVDWGKGRSFYFRDPAGNLLEIANADIWRGCRIRPPLPGNAGRPQRR